MASDEETRQTHQWEELRLGLIMNGGVSLAVWMGGVSNEIFRLVTHQHPVYRGLMDLTRTSARVDVISGTSAGGVNGAALAIALLYGGDFEQLREVWMRTGALPICCAVPSGQTRAPCYRARSTTCQHSLPPSATCQVRAENPVSMPASCRSICA